MKNFIAVAVTLLMTTICLGQPFPTSANSANYCEQIQKNINLFEKQINGLSQREYQLETSDSNYELQLKQIEEQKKITQTLLNKYTQIKTNNCHPSKAEPIKKELPNNAVTIERPKTKFTAPQSNKTEIKSLPVKDKD